METCIGKMPSERLESLLVSLVGDESFSHHKITRVENILLFPPKIGREGRRGMQNLALKCCFILHPLNHE